jgi:hypothetical protein
VKSKSDERIPVKECRERRLRAIERRDVSKTKENAVLGERNGWRCRRSQSQDAGSQV